MFKLTFLGLKTDDKSWAHFHWMANINGIDIEYRTGVGHSKTYDKNFPVSPDLGYLRLDLKDDQRHLISRKYFTFCYVKKPKLKDILYSLASDYSCASDSFEDFCANCGYDTDSRKALDTYLACQESGLKLRKIMKSKNAIERITAWEL